MAPALRLRAALTRGALVALANWPVIGVEFVIESLYKLALVVPVVGGALMVAVLAGADLRAVFAEGVRNAAGLVAASLTNAPAALASFLVAASIVALGGAIVMCLVKAGTLAILVAGERAAGDLQRAPLRYDALRGAYASDAPTLLDGVRRFGGRATILVVWLSAAYVVVGAGYLAALAWAVDLAGASEWAAAWPLVILVSSSTAVIALAAVNLAYTLLRVIVVTDDCGVGAAVARLRSFLIEDARQVVGLFGVIGVVLTLAAAASILVTASLALVAWVPVVGLIVVPLQAAAWIVRGVVLQYISLAALSAYQAQYRRFAEPGGRSEPARPLWVQHA